MAKHCGYLTLNVLVAIAVLINQVQSQYYDDYDRNTEDRGKILVIATMYHNCDTSRFIIMAFSEIPNFKILTTAVIFHLLRRSKIIYHFEMVLMSRDI